MAAVERDSVNFGLLWLVIIGIAMSAVSLYYYLILLKHMYVHKARNEERLKTPAYLNAALAVAAAGVVYLGLNPQPLLTLLTNLVERM